MGRPKKSEQGPTLADILSAIHGLTGVVDSLVKSIHEKPVQPQVTPAITPHPSISRPSSQVPQDYLDLVATVLNKKFGIEINYVKDSPSFELSILVPREYSNAPAGHWDTFKEDRRTKVIANSYGLAGVKDWVSLVYENLPIEIKAKIAADRLTS